MKKKISYLLGILGVFTMILLSAFKAEASEQVESSQNFDFEGWHSEAMQAYETYISLLESKEDDSTWKNVFDYAEITRVSVKKVYADSVKDATEEELNGLSKTDVIDYFTTYLNFSEKP